jgi:Predicted proline hydroxylase
LSNVLTSKTVQERTVRSDTVAFIDSDMARKCGIQKQFGMLMEVANYLNQNLHWDSMRSGYKPISPATEQCPLTNPANIQIASYGHGEFYVPHSDNLLVMGQNHETGASLVRSNYRQFTCILYCNDDWDMKVHGGALRIYPGTIDVTDPMSVKAHNVPYTDVNPTNGKLLIFDSRLVHSVEKVLDPYKKRLAMTIWINRPEDNGVSVNVWNENEERVEWYRLF